MCISFIPFYGRPENLSCDKTQMFLVSEEDTVRLVGLLPVKSKSESTPTLLFYPLPSCFTGRIEPVDRLLCQALRLEKLMDAKLLTKRQVKTRGIGKPRQRVQVIENNDGSLVICLTGDFKDIGQLVLKKLTEKSIDPERVFGNTGTDALNDQISAHIQDDHDLIMCVPPFKNGKPLVDGRGFSIQFVWKNNEFEGEIPMLGLCHNHAHSPKLEENYYFMTNMDYDTLVFFDNWPRSSCPLQKVANKDLDLYALQEKTLRELSHDIRRATGCSVHLCLDHMKMINLNGLDAIGCTKAYLQKLLQ